jgi:uncharacterized protein (TIGR02001 family)
MPVQPWQGQRALAPAGVQWRAARVRRHFIDGTALRGATAFLLCIFSTAVGAQISGAASLVSDYRYRGIALSDQKPAAQLGLAYDDPLGWYAGAFGSTVRLSSPASTGVQGMVYAGFAKRVASGISLEAGGDYSSFTGAAVDDYGELYLGIARENLSARIYYSPSYFGQHAKAIYGEVNGALPLTESVRLIVHVGLLSARYDYVYGAESSNRVVDGRIGIGIDFDLCRLELTWVSISNSNTGYRITGNSSPNTAVLQVTHGF